MTNLKNRINWPFAVIILMAILAVLGRFILTQHYEVPAVIRHHMADFCFAGFFTFFIVSIGALFRQRSPNKASRKRRPIYWLSIPVIGTLVGLWIEFEDFLGIDESEEGWFDPGVIIEWTGAPNTDTFDVKDLVAIAVGGVLTFVLMRLSLHTIDRWRVFPLLLKPEVVRS